MLRPYRFKKNTRPTNTSILATFSSRDHMSMRLFVLSTFCPRRMPVTICPATFSPSAVDKVNVETVVYFLFRSSFSCQPREVGSKVREKSRELSKFIVSLAFTQLIYDAVRNWWFGSKTNCPFLWTICICLIEETRIEENVSALEAACLCNWSRIAFCVWFLAITVFLIEIQLLGNSERCSWA